MACKLGDSIVVSVGDCGILPNLFFFLTRSLTHTPLYYCVTCALSVLHGHITSKSVIHVD